MGRWVLLRHEMPDGSWHSDWMIERRGVDGGALVTFRVQERPDDASVCVLSAVRIGDHRREYLEYEGEVSGGRGRVTRVASGHGDIDDVGSEIVVRMTTPMARRWVARVASTGRLEFVLKG